MGKRVHRKVYNAPCPYSTRRLALTPEDLLITRQIIDAGTLLDVQVLDHLIIGQGQFCSLRERGLGGFAQ